MEQPGGHLALSQDQPPPSLTRYTLCDSDSWLETEHHLCSQKLPAKAKGEA